MLNHSQTTHHDEYENAKSIDHNSNPVEQPGDKLFDMLTTEL
jgi:hypothetical protein